MAKNNVFKQLLGKISPSKRRLVDKQLQIANQIAHLLREQGWKKIEFAKEVGIHPSQLTHALSGEANLTLEFITKLEAGFNADIISVPLYSAWRQPFLIVESNWNVVSAPVEDFSAIRNRIGRTLSGIDDLTANYKFADTMAQPGSATLPVFRGLTAKTFTLSPKPQYASTL
jgi:transcriptional regulator with XRE-family HTH domain